MDKRQKKKKKERDIRHIGGIRRQKKSRHDSARDSKKEKETRLEYFKERIFYSKNEFAHLNEHFIFPSRMMLMMLSIEQMLDFEEHSLLFH
jgi:hypothetical protein